MPLVPSVKIIMPQLPPEFVVRSELLAELDAGAGDVVLVCAPGGYGKTLLLADWSRTSTAVDTAWVGVDRDDNDPQRLWSSVVAAIAGCPSVPQHSRLHDPRAWQHGGSRPEFIGELADTLQALPAPIRLILDDVHELGDPQVLHGVQSFIRAKPGTVQLVLCSRFDPPLSLPRLRLAGRLKELRAAQMSFTPGQAAELLTNSGLGLSPPQVELLHRRTGGWVAGLRLAALGLAESAEREGFLSQFCGDDRSVADYLVGEILSGLAVDEQEFLRVISISDPVPTGLAAALSAREDAGSVLDRLERRTSLVTAVGSRRESYRVQELLRTYLLADLQRQGARQVARLHVVAAQWWAGRHQPVPALEHAAHSRDDALVTDLLHRFAVPLIVAGDHGPLRRALASVGAHDMAADPWLALASALANVEAGELSAAQGDLRHARRCWPAHAAVGLTVLRAAAEQLGAVPAGAAPAIPEAEDLPVEPELEALARLSRGMALLERNDRGAARVEFDAALALSARHGFGYLRMQCLVLQGVVACTSEVRSMRVVSSEALDTAAEHGWEGSTWSAAASAMLAYSELQRCAAGDAKRLTADALASGRAVSSPSPLRFCLRAVHGAATFDLGDRAVGLAELQRARSDFGAHAAGPEQCAAMAMLEFRAALLLGHSAAARTVLGWLTERVGESAELLLMRAWTETAAGRHDRARILIGPVLEGSVPALVSHTAVDGWLLETSIAVVVGERPAARRALGTALALAEPLLALRPFAQARPGVRELLVHQHGSFGASEEFADRALAAGAGHGRQQTPLSEREITVLGLLPSLLSLDEIALDLAVSVNTVKSHLRSIYTKLGVSSRRLAVLAGHEHGLLTNGAR
jgi:LuxR family transcriptional regulator, maltose regulon positive regulatory protein